MLAGCQSQISAQAAAPEAGQEQNLPAAALIERFDISAPLSADHEAEPPPVARVENALPAAEPDVLVFTFPTPGPEPVSLWRPPLYEAPWALGPFDHFYFSRPIAADVVNWPLADYRYGGIFFGPDVVHSGIDIPNRIGTPVLAAAGGKVIHTGYGLFYGSNDPDDPYGQAISIMHDFGYAGQRLYTIYAHLDKIDVENGQRVEAGEKIGEVGETGMTTGPHLHFEVRIERNSFYATRNPELWLTPPQGWGLLAGRVMKSDGSLLQASEVHVRSLETGRKWMVMTYGSAAAHSDDYYQENVVLSDLPAGEYELIIYFNGEDVRAPVIIYPGSVTYFQFRGKYGFDTSTPPSSTEAFIKPAE
jgi:murein DD-endopeptidase MepM/ murein hydrolase activator NlpD